MDLSITNVVNISVGQANPGVNAYNTSNLALFTHETPAGSFGTDGYKLYVDPTDVATDFGTSSKTYVCALAVFSQQPNILAGNGQLVVVLMDATVSPVTAVQHVTYSTVPTAGTIKWGYNGNYTTALAYGASSGDIQTALQLLAGLGSATVTGSAAAGFVVTFTGVDGPALPITFSENSLQDTDGFDVFPTAVTTVVGVSSVSVETLDAAITRTVGLVQYLGVMQTDPAATITQAVVLAAAAVVQALNKILFVVSYTAADLEVGGMLDLLRTGSFDHTRGLYYGDNTGNAAIIMGSSYAGRALSVNFSGNNTTITMHLKQLIGVQPDPSMTQTLKTKALAAGVDIYVSIDGDSAVLCSGENGFFDDVYNLIWIVGALQVALFNYLAQTSTKVVQTESGMDGVKNAARQVMEQAVTNQYVAPGAWNSPVTFGVQATFLDNITQKGYYIYSLPVAQQSQVDRAARKAPLMQIALKEAGAMHSISAIVNVNA